MQTKQEQNRLLSLVPKDAERVVVVDQNGHTRQRGIREVQPTDTIQTKKDGSPVTIAGKPGRRSKAPVYKPSGLPAANPLAEKAQEERAQFIADDPMVQSLRKDAGDVNVLDYVIVEFAEELASLKFDRHMAERTGDPTSHISIRRINAMQAIMDKFAQRKEILKNSAELDLESQEMRLVYSSILDMVADCFQQEGVRPEVVGNALKKVVTMMAEGWAEDLKEEIRKEKSK